MRSFFFWRGKMAFCDPNAASTRLVSATAQDSVQNLKDYCSHAKFEKSLKYLALFSAKPIGIIDQESVNIYLAALIHWESLTGGNVIQGYAVSDHSILTGDQKAEIDEILDFADDFRIKSGAGLPWIIYCRDYILPTESLSNIDAALKLCSYITGGPSYHLNKNGFRALF
jgi:hypothetical protein